MAIQPDAEKATDKLMQMLGHTSLGILHNHYYQVVPRKEAEKFYAIRPAFRDLQVVPIRA